MSDVDPDRGVARALRLRPEPIPVMRLSRRAMVVSAGAAALAVGVVTVWAVSDKPGRVRSPEPASPAAAAPPENLASLPASYAELPPGTPRLGPPLPGDLGRAVLAEKEAPTSDAGAEAPPRAASAHEAARSSSLFGAARGTSRPTPEARATPLALVSERQAAERVLSAGTIVAAALVTGLNSDLPGPVIAQVTEDVFDSASGQVLLIPRGSRLLGAYENKVAFGQDRVLVTWSRLVLPNGRSIELGDLPATDGQGFAGVHDRVDRHWGRVIAGAATSLVVAAASRLGERDDEDALVRALRRGGSDAAEEVGGRVVDRSLDIQPTLVVRSGHAVRLVLTRDLHLEAWR